MPCIRAVAFDSISSHLCLISAFAIFSPFRHLIVQQFNRRNRPTSVVYRSVRVQFVNNEWTWSLVKKTLTHSICDVQAPAIKFPKQQQKHTLSPSRNELYENCAVTIQCWSTMINRMKQNNICLHKRIDDNNNIILLLTTTDSIRRRFLHFKFIH